MNQMAKGSKAELDAALNAIRNATSSNNGWVVIARLTEDVRRSGNWRLRYHSPTEWLNAAADAANCTPNTLRRFLAAFRFLEERGEVQSTNIYDPFAGSGGLAIGSVELIKRIADIAPPLAEDVLRKHKAGEIRYRQVKSIYDGLINQGPQVVFVDPPYASNALETGQATPVAGKLGLRRSIENREKLLAITRKSVTELSGEPGVVVSGARYDFEYCSPEAVIVGKEEFAIKFVDAIEFHQLPSRVSPGAFRKILAEVVFSATFFRWCWLMIECTDPKVADSFASTLQSLDAHSVGIAEVSLSKNRLRVIRKPSARPVPDRHDLSRAKVFREGVAAR